MIDQNYMDTAHLLRRAGFGARPEDVRTAATAGIAATTRSLLNPEDGPADPNDTGLIEGLIAAAPERKDKQTPPVYVKMWWIQRMLTTQHPLREKMVLFWHGHFTSKLGDGDSMLAQNQLFRDHALGNFRTLARAVSRDPAMLNYLNGNQNFKAHPNENYARELMELFTCGIGNYTEDDVKAAARAFSGWNLRQGEFYFNPRQHDDDVKTFLGSTGNWNGDDIVDMLVAHPSTARRLCTQLFEYLAYPNPEPAVLAELTRTYYAGGFDIRSVVERILTSAAFYSPRARLAIIKCPAQYVVGSVKMLSLEPAFTLTLGEIGNLAGATLMSDQMAPAAASATASRKAGRLAGLATAMRSMGQDLLAPPSVKGWDGGEAWINTATLMNRISFANRFTRARALYDLLAPKAAVYAAQSRLPDVLPAGQEQAGVGADADGWVDYLANALGPLPLEETTRRTLIDFASGQGAYAGGDSPGAVAEDPLQGEDLDGPADRGGPVGRLLAVIPLIMATPEYQVC